MQTINLVAMQWQKIVSVKSERGVIERSCQDLERRKEFLREKNSLRESLNLEIGLHV